MFTITIWGTYHDSLTWAVWSSGKLHVWSKVTVLGSDKAGQCRRTQSCPTRKSCPFPLSQAAYRKFFTTNPMWNRKPVSRDETTRPRSHRLQAMNKDPWAQVRFRGRPCSSYYCPEGAKGRILGWTPWKKESNCWIDCNVLGEVGALRISR